jgi:hypothetical protein
MYALQNTMRGGIIARLMTGRPTLSILLGLLIPWTVLSRGLSQLPFKIFRSKIQLFFFRLPKSPKLESV